MKTMEEKAAHSDQPCKLWLVALEVRVRFACRLFFQSRSRGNSRKSQQLRVDPKQTHYTCNQYLMALDPRMQSQQPSKQPHKILVKLLSNRGLEFTAGSISIADFPSCSQIVIYEVSKSSDIEVRCSIKFQYCRGEGTIIGKLDDIQEEAQQTSKLEEQSPEAREEHMPFATLPQHSKVLEKTLSPLRRKENPRKYSETNLKKNFPKDDHVSFLGSDQSDAKSSKLPHFQSWGYNHLYEKQREMIDTLQKKHREALHQEERLKINLSKYEIELQRKRQKINELEEERIKLMKQQLEKDKNIGVFGENMRKLLDQTEKDVIETLGQLLRRREKIVIEHRLSDSVIQKEETDSETPLKLLDKQPIETESHEESLVQSINDINLSPFAQIRQELVSHERRSSALFLPSESVLNECLSNVNLYCSRITSHTEKFSASVGRKLSMLSKNNVSFKNRLVQSRQEYELSEESLVAYLQQLQTTLERQLQLVNEKEQVIMNCFSIIEGLNHKIADCQSRIKELEDSNLQLADEKEFIKTELHENNYLFAVKEDQFIQKIQTLEASLNSLQVQNIKSSSDVLGPFNEPSQDNDDSNSVLGEYCQRIRNKEMELLYEKREKQRLIEQLSDREDELRSALLEKRKLQFAMKLKDKMSGSEKEIDRSFEVSEEDIKKRTFLEEEFLGILT